MNFSSDNFDVHDKGHRKTYSSFTVKGPDVGMVHVLSAKAAAGVSNITAQSMSVHDDQNELESTLMSMPNKLPSQVACS